MFPDLDNGTLCQLAELDDIRPSTVLELVPQASRAQIGAFLQIAEDSIFKVKGGGRHKAHKAPRRDVSPVADKPISLFGDLKRSQKVKPGKEADLSCPTDEQSKFMRDLGKLIPQKNGGNVIPSIEFSEKFQEKILNLLEAANKNKDFDVAHFEEVYEKLCANPLARSRLENLHAARSHKYGHAHFGPKTWYKESTNLAKKFKSQAHRRKFRVGLKGLVDFLNQLNILDLEKSLADGNAEGFKLLKMPVAVLPETFCQYLKNVPPMSILKFINPQKATVIRKLMDKISSLAHFSQSMADFFAHDDALEPALAVICEVLRNKEDLAEVLKKRGATFLSLAQPYDKHRSAADHDVVETKKPEKTVGSKRSRGFHLPCFNFQKGECKFRDCKYKHECSRCGSRRHGGRTCPDKHRKSPPRKFSRTSSK